MTNHIQIFDIADGESESITLHGRSTVQSGIPYQVEVACSAGSSQADAVEFKYGTLLVWALAK